MGEGRILSGGGKSDAEKKVNCKADFGFRQSALLRSEVQKDDGFGGDRRSSMWGLEVHSHNLPEMTVDYDAKSQFPIVMV